MSALEVVMMKRIGELKAEIEALQAEVERLTHLANQSEFYRSQLQKDTCRLENIQMQDAFRHYEVENARLKAEVVRLTEERCFLNERLNHFVKETVKNREQVERLRKAGDKLAGVIGLPVNDVQTNALVEAWNAAKEDFSR